MATRPSPAARRGSAARWILPALVLVLAAVVHVVVREAGERRERDAVRERAAQAAADLTRRIEEYGDVLYGVRGLFAASATVSHAEFHASQEANEVQRRFPGVRVIGFADLLDAGDAPRRLRVLGRSARESRLGYPPLAVRLGPARQQVAPITYLDPVAGNELAFGFDLLGETVRRTAFERTLATGSPEATAPVRLRQATGPGKGFLVMLATRDAAGRARGVAYAAFQTPVLLERVLPARSRRASLELYDLGRSQRAARALADAELTYDDDRTRDALDPRRPAFGEDTVRFEVMGRWWALHYEPAVSLQPEGQELLDWAPLIVGAGLALVAFWVLSLSHRTERRAVALAERMTESLRSSQTDLARSNAELERFAYVASHDLREPLRTITGFLGLLSRRYRHQLDHDGREFIDLAVSGAKRMDTLIAELLEYSRAGRQETTSEPTDLEAAWRVAVGNLSAAIAEARAEVTAGPLPVVMADRGEMVQVLQNLVGNAIKYRGDHPPRIRAEAVRRGDHWELTIADDGPGIDPRHHERIFVLLQRLHRHDDVEGTGMGLAICKKIVESHGGRIWVESREGEGARFRFTLPAAPDAERRPREEPLGAAAT